MFDSLAGHLWTIVPALGAFLHPPSIPRERRFQTVVHDPVVGAVRLSGRLSEIDGADTLVLIIHGLSGNAESPYCARAAQAAARAGFSSLRLSLRGADYSGEDILHGGISEDVWAALADAELARYKHIFLLGYSVGGHVAMRAAVEGVDARLRAVAAICPPLDLQQAAAAFDHPARRPYRAHIFRDLNKAYAATARRGRVEVSPAIVARALLSRERDALTVVPRFGFRNVDDYYERESVGHKLNRLQIPSLVVLSRHDPLIPEATVLPALGMASSALTVKWVEPGGHVYFPGNLDLGLPGPLGLESQVMGWLAARI